MWLYITITVCLLWFLEARTNSPKRKIKRLEKMAKTYYDIAWELIDTQMVREEDKEAVAALQRYRERLKAMDMRYDYFRSTKFAEASPEDKMQLASSWYTYCRTFDNVIRAGYEMSIPLDRTIQEKAEENLQSKPAMLSEIEQKFEYLSKSPPFI